MMLHTPLGAKLALCITHESHFKACIRESCRFPMFSYLASRLAHEDANAAAALAKALKDPKLKHKSIQKHKDDFLGMHPYVDIEAAMSLSKGRTKSQ